MNKYVKPYLLEIIFIVALFSGIGFYLHVKYVEPNQIQQEVTELLFHEKLRLYQDWEMSNRVFNDGRVSMKKNPYGDLDKPCYTLMTKLGDEFEYDYGTEDYILVKKCERYAEFEQNRAKFLADKEAEELAIEKKEQEQEDALDRLNEKSCN